MIKRLGIVLYPSTCLSCFAVSQLSTSVAKGTLIVDGGGTSKLVVEKFVALAGGSNARIVVIPTGVSALKFGPNNTILNPDWPRERPEWAGYEAYLKQMFGTQTASGLPVIRPEHVQDRV